MPGLGLVMWIDTRTLLALIVSILCLFQRLLLSRKKNAYEQQKSKIEDKERVDLFKMK